MSADPGHTRHPDGVPNQRVRSVSRDGRPQSFGKYVFIN